MMQNRRSWISIAVLVTALVFLVAGESVAADADYINKMRTAARFMAQGIPDGAARILEQVLAKHPNDLRASVSYVDALIAMRQFDEAEAFIDSAFEKIKETSDLYRSRVKLRRAQGRDRDAYDDVIRVMETNPERATWAFRETQDLLDSGLDPEATHQVAEDMRKAHPDDLQFTVLSAVVITHGGEIEEALRLMTRFDEDHKRDGEALLRFAQEMQAMGNEEVALEGMLAAVERAPKATKRSYILEMVAAIQERQGKYVDALASLAIISEQRKGTTAAGNALLRSAEIHQKFLDDPRGALEVYERIKNDPILGHHRPKMLLQMADCHVRLGQFEQAAETYTQVKPEALDPEHAEMATLKLAEVEFYRGNSDSALTLFQQMAEEYPRSLFTDQAASRYIMLNKYQGLADGEAVATWGKMEWAMLLGDSVTVDTSARSLLMLHPEGELSAVALLALAEISETGGNFMGALGFLENLSEAFPKDRRAPESLMRQGAILELNLGRRQEALMRYETILTEYPDSVQAGDARRLVEALRRELKS